MRTSRRTSHAWFLEQFEDLVQANKLRVTSLGTSEEGRPLFAYQWGSGSRRWMAWSQMHGDEFSSTHTLLRWIQNLSNLPQETARRLEDLYSFMFLPVVNPDGLVRASRENANGIDLNRDFNIQQAVETRILRNHIDAFQPHLCFNMHDQRSIFAVDSESAAGSILVPFSSGDKLQNDPWTTAASSAGKLATQLQLLRPDLALGKYTDDFYPEAFGDNLMAEGFPNILVECGFAGDLERMDVVQWWADALTRLMTEHAATQENFIPRYLEVPFMTKQFADLVCISDQGSFCAAFILAPSPTTETHRWEFQSIDLDVFDCAVEGRITWKYRDEDHLMVGYSRDHASNRGKKTTLTDPAGQVWEADAVAALISQNPVH